MGVPTSRRSSPAGSNPGTISSVSILSQLGNEDWKCVKDVTPGQVSSSGVPSNLGRLILAQLHLGVGHVSHLLEDLKNLINLRVPLKQRLPRTHLREYTPHTPHIDSSTILLPPQQDLRGTIPQRDDLMRVTPQRHPERPCEPKVRELQVPLLINQKILGLEIPM